MELVGKKDCSIGSKITNIQSCRAACNELNKAIGVLRKNKPCYIAGNGKCRKDGRQGSRARLVCMIKGIMVMLISYTHGYLDCLLLAICFEIYLIFSKSMAFGETGLDGDHVLLLAVVDGK